MGFKFTIPLNAFTTIQCTKAACEELKVHILPCCFSKYVIVLIKYCKEESFEDTFLYNLTAKSSSNYYHCSLVRHVPVVTFD
jgi:hypothetical protein